VGREALRQRQRWGGAGGAREVGAVARAGAALPAGCHGPPPEGAAGRHLRAGPGAAPGGAEAALMIVALDIDGTNSERTAVLALLSSALRAAGHRVLVLTYRDPARADHTRAELAGWGIAFDELVFAPSLEGKGALCRAHAVDVFVDDQDECLVGVPEATLVLK